MQFSIGLRVLTVKCGLLLSVSQNVYQCGARFLVSDHHALESHVACLKGQEVYWLERQTALDHLCRFLFCGKMTLSSQPIRKDPHQ